MAKGEIDLYRLKYLMTGEYDEVMLRKKVEEQQEEIERLNKEIERLNKEIEEK